MNPLLIFLILFVGVPLVELYFLIEVGSEIGAISTIALTIFTAVLGGMLVRMQGFATALRVRDALEREEVPAIEMMEGAILLVTGLMLLLPGFITDAIGFLLLVPPVRQALLLRYLRSAGVMQTSAPRDAGTEGAHRQAKVIEGEYHRVDRD
jgi:UPF0716 protein FxsA